MTDLELQQSLTRAQRAKGIAERLVTSIDHATMSALARDARTKNYRTASDTVYALREECHRRGLMHE